MPDKITDFLIAGRDVIANEKHWTQGTMARDQKGVICDNPWEEDAFCFCTVGAILKVAPRGTDNLDIRRKIKDRLCAAGGIATGSLIHFNDNHTHAEVLAVWDKAIVFADHE